MGAVKRLLAGEGAASTSPKKTRPKIEVVE
jgi:hypothetical protein